MRALFVTTFVAVSLLPLPAFAWNNRGHMLVAQLAWQELPAAARQAAFEVLQQHPHYAEFLEQVFKVTFCERVGVTSERSWK
jgi:hypothetical protein